MPAPKSGLTEPDAPQAQTAFTELTPDEIDQITLWAAHTPMPVAPLVQRMVVELMSWRYNWTGLAQQTQQIMREALDQRDAARAIAGLPPLEDR